MIHASPAHATFDAEPKRFVVLDSWRGLAALLVVILHMRYRSHWYNVALVRNGWLAVDFFFVLSGFVIAHAYAGRIADARSFGRFVIRRTGRLWPLHVFVLAGWVLPWTLGQTRAYLAGRPWIDTGENTPYTLVTNLLLIHSLGLHRDLTWNPPSWSVSTEYYTCLLFGLVVLWRRRLTATAAAALASAGAAAVIVFAKGEMGSSIDFGFFRCMYGFFTGVVVYLVFRRLRPLTIASRAASVLEGAVVLVACAFIASSARPPGSLLAPIVFGTSVFVFAQQRGHVSRLLEQRVFATLGTLSYSIYLTHAFVFMWIHRAYAFAGPRLGLDRAWIPLADGRFEGNPWIADAWSLIFVVVVIAVSMFTYRFVEQPGRRAFNRLAEHQDTPALQPHPV